MTLAEFIIARLDAWEYLAKDVLRNESVSARAVAEFVIADCEAKRRIVVDADNYSPELEHGDNGEWAFDQVLRLLALPYADRDDYDPAWRPR